jgi:hypothetical protein
LLAVAGPPKRLASDVVSARKVPAAVVLQLRSPAGLLARAGTPGDVFTAVQRLEPARRLSVHAAFALTVNVGPVVALKPASKSAGVGVLRDVDAALAWSLTTRPAVIETLPAWLHVAGAPDAVHWPEAAAGTPINSTVTIAAPLHRIARFIGTPSRL